MTESICHVLSAKNLLLATAFLLHGNVALAALGFALALLWYTLPIFQPSTRQETPR